MLHLYSHFREEQLEDDNSNYAWKEQNERALRDT